MPRPHKALSWSSSANVFAFRCFKPRNTIVFLVALFYFVLLFRASIYVASNADTNKQVIDEQSTTQDPPNTNWKNVQYNRGIFGQKSSSSHDKFIRRKCSQFLGYYYLNYGRHFTSNNNCFGPLPTNTTCCYCFVSRDGEQQTQGGSYKYWSCAVARENSLLPLNSTRIDTKGGRIAWITGKFGYDSRFKNDVDIFCSQVKAMRLFDPQDAFCYWDSPDYVLRNKKFERHLRYRSDPNDTSAKGAGFWFHKSVLVRHQMNKYKHDDFIVYSDIDRIDFFELGTFNAVVETIARRGDDLSIDVMGAFRAENLFTKEDLLAAFNASKTMRESAQVSASWIVLRNSPKMKRFIDAWIECVADWHMVSDEPSVWPNAPGFKEHRHDQSILGLLIKRFMTKEGIVGPPARPVGYNSDIVTYKFQKNVDPTCPFSSFGVAKK